MSETLEEIRNPACKTLAQIKQEHILHVLEQCGGNKNKASKLLGIDRRSLYRMLANMVKP